MLMILEVELVDEAPLCQPAIQFASDLGCWTCRRERECVIVLVGKNQLLRAARISTLNDEGW